MKNILKVSLLVVLVVFASCKDSKTSTESSTDNQLYSCSMHPEITGKKGEACSICGMELTEPVVAAEPVQEEEKEVVKIKSKSNISIDAILDDYLKLKNALTLDDSNAAASAGTELVSAVSKLNTDKIEAELKDDVAAISEHAIENAKHIGDNGGKMDHQREHFAKLSKNISDLLAIFETDKKLYQDYCPMYDEGKSGYWISETKDIKNPYYGSEMLTCGGIHKEL